MAKEISFLNPRKQSEQHGLKTLIHAPSGSGKTHLAKTTGEPTVVIDAEAGILPLRDAPKDLMVYTINSIEDLTEIYQYLKANKEFQWIYIDSITEVAEKCLAHELDVNPDNRRAYGELITKMTSIIKAFRDLSGYDVVMTAKQDRVRDEGAGKMLYQPMMPGAKLAQQLPYMFDLVLALRVEKTQEGEITRWLQTNRDDQYEAKDRSGLLDLFEKPDLSALKQKILGAPRKSPAAAKAA